MTVTYTATSGGGGGGGNPGGGGTGTGGGITASSYSVNWSSTYGTSTQVTLYTTNTAGVSYYVTSNETSGNSVTWLSAYPGNGTVTQSSPVTLTVQFNPNGLSPSTYYGAVTVNYGTTSLTISVTYQVVYNASTGVTINPTTASWGYSPGGTVPYTDMTVTVGTTYFNAISNASWILLTWPSAPSSVPPQPSWSGLQASSGLRAIYNTAATTPTAGTQGTVTVSDTNGNQTTFTVTFTGGGSSGSGTVTLSPNPVTLTCAANAGSSCAQQTVTIQSSVAGTLSVSLSGSAASYVGSQVANGATSINSGGSVSVVLTANANGLSSQTYSGTLIVSVVSNGTTYQATDPVSFVVGSGGSSGTVTVSPNSVTLNCAAYAGNSCAQETVTVTSTIAGSLSVSLSGSASNYVGSQVANGATSINAGGQVNVVLTASATGISSQSFSGTLTVSVVSNGTTYQATVPVSFVVGSGGGGTTTPNILVAPSSLSFSVDMNHLGAIYPQFLTVADPGTYSATVTNGSNWLSIGSASGSSPGLANPALIQVIASPANLSAGTYTGTISVTSPSGTTTVTATLQVYSSAIIYATTGGAASINYTEVGGNLVGVVPTLYVYASDSSSMNVQASTPSGSTWLQVAPTSGTTPAAGFQVIFSAATLSNGVYVGSVTFTSSTAANTVTVPVVLSVASSASSSGVTLTQSTISLNTAVNGSSVSQSVGVQASTSTSFSASSNQSWLSVTSSGTTPANITVTANPYGLSAGTYYGTITVVGGGTTATAQVTFQVGNSSSGGGNVTSNYTSLTFNYQVGGSTPASQSLIISNQVSGTAQIPFTITTGINGGSSNWLTATVNGATQANTQATVQVSVNPGALPTATYTGYVTITPSGGNALTIPVTLNIQGTPTVTASPSQLTYSYEVGGTTPPTQAIQVTGTQTGLTYSATATTASGGNWLVVSKSSGTTPDVLSVSISPSGLSAGSTYTGTVVVQGTGSAAGSSSISVTLTIAAPAPNITSVVHGATFQSGAVAPGEIVTIFGANLGPATALQTKVDPTTGKVETSLGNVQALFNGYAAPLIYVSATQINCVVPYELAQITSPYVEVKYLNQTSQTVSLRAAATAPGIFTAPSGGTGQGAVLNSDSSANSSSHPAPAGSTIQVFMTGEGQLSPPGVTGSVTCAAGCATVKQIPVPLLPVAALIGGQPATISFYGEAPGDVSGVMQVDVTIPPGTPSGAASLVISVGGNSSPSGVTISVQ
jgi:uncharacterized protein (TIGR03437 family)